MMKKLRTFFAVVVILALVIPASAQAPNSAGPQAKAKRASYVVLMAADPTIAYEGDVMALQLTDLERQDGPLRRVQPNRGEGRPVQCAGRDLQQW